MCRIDPRVDFAFKKLFGVEENKDLLIDFINSIVSENDKVADITILNPYSVKNFKTEKMSIMDIKAKSVSGKWYNIEMQITDQEYFDKRALYYWSRLYNGQLSTGINYDKLNKSIGINILNFNCLDEEKYHNVYKIKNIENGNEFIDDLEIHFIEIEKYDEKMSTMLDRWVNFLKKAGFYTMEDMPKELEEVHTIKKAVELLETMSFTELEREDYEARLKWLRDEEMAIKTAEKKGIAIGMEKEKVRIAMSLLDVLDLETISLKTGLSVEFLEGLGERIHHRGTEKI